MKQLLLVFLGGGIGSMLRYLIGKALNAQNMLPYGTFLANILGCFIIGIILGAASKTNTLSQHQTLFIATGFCGGFTTFSSFVYENQTFLKSGDFANFAIYTIGSFSIGLVMVFAGLYLTK